MARRAKARVSQEEKGVETAEGNRPTSSAERNPHRMLGQPCKRECTG